jgi:DNA-binding transcriptional regulator GbsR (MarR family)
MDSAGCGCFLTKGGSILSIPGRPLLPTRLEFFMELKDSEPLEVELAPFQQECINLFVHAAQILSIPRSVGEIYGLLYSSREPLAMDDVIDKLSMSKGSASQGLRWLRDIGAVRTTYVAGDRRDFFVAETELRKLAFGFLRESIEPHLNRGIDYLERVDQSISATPAGELRRFAEERAKKLRRWHRFVSQVLPLLLRVAEKF